jgi:hypothetical protein
MMYEDPSGSRLPVYPGAVFATVYPSSGVQLRTTGSAGSAAAAAAAAAPIALSVRENGTGTSYDTLLVAPPLHQEYTLQARRRLERVAAADAGRIDTVSGVQPVPPVGGYYAYDETGAEKAETYRFDVPPDAGAVKHHTLYNMHHTLYNMHHTLT